MKKLLIALLCLSFSFCSFAGQYQNMQRAVIAKRQSSVGFTPASLTGILLWLEADEGVYTDAGSTICVNNNDRLYQWNDKSGNGYNFTETAFKPWFKTNILNNHPVIGFYYPDNSASFISNTSLANNQKPQTIAIVIRLEDVTANGVIYGGQSGTTGGFQLDVNSNHFRLVSPGGAVIGSNTSSISIDTWYLLIATYDASGNYTFTLNGSSDGSGTNDRTLINYASSIGKDSSNIVMKGDIAALVRTSAIITSDEKTNLATYWNTKYVIY